MVEKKFAVVGLACLIMTLGFVGAFTALSHKVTEMQIKSEQIVEMEFEKSSLETQLSNLQTQNDVLANRVSEREIEISTFRDELDSLKYEKGTLENQISLLESKRAVLEKNNKNMQSEIATLDNNLIDLEIQVSNLQFEVTDLENELIQNYNLGYLGGEAEGYELGYDDGYNQGLEDGMGNGWYLVDPTYEEMLTFVQLDTIDENEYTEYYVCYDFTADFNSNAFQAGYRCGFVYIEFFDGAHAISCFNTTDNGLVFIEPQTDEIVNPIIGQQYEGYTIKDIGIIW